jgi:hypothetical protein
MKITKTSPPLRPFSFPLKDKKVISQYQFTINYIYDNYERLTSYYIYIYIYIDFQIIWHMLIKYFESYPCKSRGSSTAVTEGFKSPLIGSRGFCLDQNNVESLIWLNIKSRGTNTDL